VISEKKNIFGFRPHNEVRLWGCWKKTRSRAWRDFW